MCKSVVYQSLDDFKIDGNDIVSVEKAGNVIKVKYVQKVNTSIGIKKLNDDMYLNLSTGEVKEFKKSNNRSQSLRSLKNSMERLRALINANTVNYECCRWVTLTYKENMQDTKRLYYDVDKLIKRVRYKFGHFEYIHVAEPQARGAWHIHAIWIFEGKAPFISQRWLAGCWGHGSGVTVQKLRDNCDNLGAYLSAYLGNVSIDDACDDDYNYCTDIIEVEVDENGEKINKKFLKGARLHLYPSNMKLYRCSRGVKYPSLESMTYLSAKEKIGSLKPTFSKSYKIKVDDFENIISTEYYNIKNI